MVGRIGSMSDDQTVDLDFKPVAGPGVTGAEHDVPVYHFDISGVDVPEMLADPIGFLAKRGIKEYQDKSPGASMQVVMQSFADEEFMGEDAVRWCCYDVGVGRTCVRHN
jgi:hypothetical protein